MEAAEGAGWGRDLPVGARDAQEATATSGEVGRGRPEWFGTPMAVLRGGLAVGMPSYDAVMSEHAPQMPGGDSCRACGFVYADHSACPAVILAAAGFAELADRVRVVPESEREHEVLCELTVAVQRMGARLDVVGASIAAAAAPRKMGHPSRARRRWIVGFLGLRRPEVSR